MKTFENYCSSIGLVTVLSVTSLAFVPNVSNAQEEEAAEIEEVIVTGSRIKRPAQDAAVPIMEYLNDEITTSSDIDLSRMIRDLPNIYQGTSTENSQSNPVDSGIATVELRNLSSDRTLVLIDGKRTVTNSLNNNSVSLDTIPTGFIERVEVMTGGASAVYGSDAVGGVVNIVTRDYFEGVEVDIRAGSSQNSDGEQVRFEVTAGTNFANDNGNVLVNYTYDESEDVRLGDLDWAQTSLDINGDCCDFSSAIPGGRYLGRDFFYDTETNELMRDFSTSRDGFDTRVNSPRTARIAKERNLLALKMRYDFTENVAAVLQTHFASIATLSNRQPRNATSSASSLASTIPLNNPFIPQEILDQAIADGDSGISLNRRFMELDPRSRGGTRDTLRVWFGLEGTIKDNWDWQMFFGKHSFRYNQLRTGNLNKINFGFAMDVEPDPDNPGGYRCVSELARKGNCVAANIFGVGTITPEGAAWLRNSDFMTGKNDETQIAANVTGDLMELPAGPLGFAAGVEYRESKTKTVWDDISNADFQTISQQIDQSGSFDVVEAFVETIVPVFENFDLELAYRYASYNNMPAVDTTDSYRFGFNWGINDSLRLRAMFGTAERAPNVLELFSKGTGATNTINDPCDDVTLSSAGVVDDNCRTIASVLANIQTNGSFTRDTSEFISYPLSGNTQLEEESAETITAGFVFTPTSIDGLILTFDYYDIEIDGAIDNLGRQDLVELCLENPDYDSNDVFCSAIHRDDATGEIFLVERKQININALRTAGFDTTIMYDFDIGFMPGEFTVDAKHTHVTTFEEDFITPQGPVTIDSLGEISYPENRMKFSLRWLHDDWSVRWRTLMWDRVADGAELDDGSILTVGTYFKSELNVGRDVDWFGSDTHTRLYFGIDNVFDRDPPLLLDGSEYGGTVPTSTNYSIIGRYFYVGMNAAF